MAPWPVRQVGCQPVRQGWRLHRTSWILMNQNNTSTYFNHLPRKNQDKADRTEFYETQYDKSTTCAFDRQLSQGLATETLATEDGRPIAVVKRETTPIAGMVFECGKGSFFACWACWWFPWTSSSTRNRIRVHMVPFTFVCHFNKHPVSELAHQHRVEWSTAQCQDCMASTLLEICAKKMQYWLCCSSLIHSYWVVLPNSSLTCKKLFVCSHKVTKQELAKGWWMQWRPSIYIKFYIHFSTCLYRVACGTRSLSSLPAEAGIQSKPGWDWIGIGWGPIDTSLDPHWCIILLYSAESGWDGWAWRCLNVLWFQAGPVPKLREKAAWVVSNVVSCCACWSCEAVNLRPT